ncbi:MAG TPA: hypothetical protein VED86_06030 [archaeon]|nr:hypothetical protein [archaeon]
MDPIAVMNLAFDLVIVVLSACAYGKKRSTILLWITVAFCFFAASYVLSILGFGVSLILIPLRAVGYLSIIAGLALHYIQQR